MNLCTKCYKPCEVKPFSATDDRTHPILSVCCAAPVKVRPS